MFQIDNSTAVAERPAPAAAGAPGWATSGNPAAGEQPTSLDADYVNGLQGELLSILQAAGIAPDKTQINQVLKSIQLLTLKWLGGGVYRGVNYIANSRTLDASYCGYLNILINVPVETLPLADSVPAGTPIDFACQAGGAVIARQGGDQISLQEAGVTQYVCGTSSKVRFVSDGNATWEVAQESNLYAPDFRGNPTAPTPPRNAAGIKLGTLDYVRSLGPRYVAMLNFTGAGTDAGYKVHLGTSQTLPTSSAIAAAIGGAGASLTIGNTSTLPITLTAAAGDIVFGYGSSITLAGLETIELTADGGTTLFASGGFGGFGRNGLELVRSTAITGQVSNIDFTWSSGQYSAARLELIGINGTVINNPQGGVISGLNLYYLSNGVWTLFSSVGLGSASSSGSGTPGLTTVDGFAGLSNLRQNFQTLDSCIYNLGQGVARPATARQPADTNNQGISITSAMLDGTAGVTGLRVAAVAGTYLTAGTVFDYAR